MGRNRLTVGDATTALPFRILANIYVGLFGRKLFYRWNQRLLNLAVRGMGVGNPTTHLIGPAEERFLNRIAAVDELAVFDVGAHHGDYAAQVRRLCPAARVWSFEPHPAAFELLTLAAERSGFTAVNVGLSDVPGRLNLYDYASTSVQGSSHATLHGKVFEDIHHSEAAAVEVEITTVDLFMESQRISHLHLLKVDAEGHELAILRGSQRAITSGAVDVVQFEFNEMNVMSRVFFRDFYDALPGFSFYRMVVDGLVPIGAYQPRTHELFILQNIIAIRDKLEYGPSLI
jgi:FkbM family methyltransferase